MIVVIAENVVTVVIVVIHYIQVVINSLRDIHTCQHSTQKICEAKHLGYKDNQKPEKFDGVFMKP